MLILNPNPVLNSILKLKIVVNTPHSGCRMCVSNSERI